jgi:multiple sugar transport system permease protein
LIILSDAKKFTMPILIATIKGIFLSNYGAMYVAIATSIFPVIVVYCFLSRYIINGLTIGAEK